ncbi:MAG: ribonuclease P protein component [Candidatus Aminicenantes bacterium]|nr:MAG: ribonuclease P protein component [Candidatus Aminicenantes bacterium]
MNETFGPHERIRKRNDFLFLYRKGKRYRGIYFNLIYFSNNLSFSRLAVVVSKKIGNAVKRNKIKRWMRSLFRRNKDLLKDSFDIIIIVKKEIQDVSWPKLEEEYLSAVESICNKNDSR